MPDNEKSQEVKQPWECMADTFKQIRNLFEPEKKEKKEAGSDDQGAGNA